MTKNRFYGKRTGRFLSHCICMLLGAVLMAGLFTGCGSKDKEGAENTPVPTAGGGADAPEERLAISVAALKGPTAIGMVELMERAENKETANDYSFTVAGTADEITKDIVKGNIQIAAVPCNLASVLYNRTEGQLQVAAINTVSVLYILETGEDINSVGDLSGRTIYSTGKETTPEYTLNYILSAAGLDPEKDVTVEYKSEAAEVAAMLAESDSAVAMLPQPYVTVAMTQNEKLRIALDVAEEWERYSEDGSSVVTGVVLVNKQYAQEHKEAVDAFLSEYQASTQYVTENVDAAAELVEKYDIVKAAVAKKAIPYCNITFIEGEEMQKRISGYLEVLYGQNPESVGGALPGEDFYYSR